MSHIFDYLKDLVAHTYALGNIDLVKVTGTAEETTFNAISDDKTVILQARAKTLIPEFIGMFGMPNLAKLSTVLSIPEYKDSATIGITKKKDSEALAGIHFENKTKDFVNDYRFMSGEIVAEKVTSLKFRGARWAVDVEPTNNAIQRFKYQAAANVDETVFVASVEGSNLVFTFGDHSTHAGNFVFESNISGKILSPKAWPVSVFANILSLPGDKRLRISDAEGAVMITVDSGLVEYEYIILAQSK